jgi:hypothetical protein
MWFATRSEVQILSQRRSLVRDLITTFRESMRSPFPQMDRSAGFGKSRRSGLSTRSNKHLIVSKMSNS